MKIGIAVDQLVPGGVQKSAIQEAKDLKRMGHEVTLLVLVRLDQPYQYQDLSKGLKVVFLSDYNPPFFRQALRIPYFAFLTHLHLLNPIFAKRYDFLKELDFIISHGTTTCITIAAVSRKLKIPFMAFIWDPMIFIWEKVYSSSRVGIISPLIKPLIKFYERSFLVSAALVATSSKVHQKFIQDIYHVDPVIIYPGCTPTLPPKKSGTYILGYSRWELAKNPQLFLYLAKKIPKVHFLIAGSWTDQSEEKEFKKEIEGLRLTDRFTFVAPIESEDLQKLAEQSLVWLHPNFEAFGMAGLEMASLGLPIIIPSGSGLTEIFQEGVHGFFPKAKDREGFLKSLKFLLEYPEKAQKMGKSARLLAQSYTWHRHSQKVIQKIEEYLNQKKAVCLACAFVSSRATGGGDQFLMELTRRAPKNIHLTIVLPQIGLFHYQKAGIVNPNIRFQVLPSTRFDNKDDPFSILFAYFARSLQTLLLLPKLPPFYTLHGATDLTPDVLPAFLFHLFNRKINWTNRFFHFIENPFLREGRWWVNIGSFLLQQISLKLLKTANLVMVDNNDLRAGLEKKGIKPSSLEVHPGGVDVKSIARIRPNPKYDSSALFIGRLAPHKGVFDAIDVWKKVVKVKKRAKLIMIGHGPDDIFHELKKRIKKARLEKNIKLTGYIHDRKKIYSYCRSSKLLLFLDHEAGFGLVNVEAMAAGLPVVAYDLPIFGGTFKKGFLTAPKENTSAIADLVLDLLQEEKQKKLSFDARQEAKRFDWQIASRKFYRSLFSR